MPTTVYVVMSGGATHQPDSAFTDQVKADAYAARENNLAKQRAPHPARSWRVFPLVVDERA